MAKDFRADRLRTRAIIGTGSVASGKKNLNLMLYSGSKATDFDGNHSISMSGVGDDIWMFVDGTASTSTNPHLRPAGGGVLFRGDVIVSGTLWAERSVVEVDDSVVGNFQAPNKIIAGHSDGSGGDLQTGFARLLVDPTTSNPSANRDGTISFNMVQGAAGVFSYATQFPSKHKDVFFHVSGSRGVKDSNDRGLALFDGDLHTSGNLSIEGSLTLGSALSVPGDLEIGGDLKLGGNDIKNSDNEICITLDADQNVSFAKGIKVNNDALTGSDGTIFLVHSGSGAVGIAGNLQVTGRRIKSDDGSNAITLKDPTFGNILHGNSSVGGELIITGNKIKSSGGGDTITMDSSDNVSVGGNLTVTGNSINGSAGANLTLGSAGLVAVAGNLQVNGAGIKGPDGAKVLHMSGSGNATIEKNLTVVGDLNVSGSVTSLAVENLNVEDPLILLGSGSTSLNSNGGIAIASGSSVANQALTFGRGSENNRWRAGRMDIQEGTGSPATSVAGATVIPLEAAGLFIENPLSSNDFFVTASLDGSGTKHHVTMSNPGGGIKFESASDDFTFLSNAFESTATAGTSFRSQKFAAVATAGTASIQSTSHLTASAGGDLILNGAVIQVSSSADIELLTNQKVNFAPDVSIPPTIHSDAGGNLTFQASHFSFPRVQDSGFSSRFNTAQDGQSITAKPHRNAGSTGRLGAVADGGITVESATNFVLDVGSVDPPSGGGIGLSRTARGSKLVLSASSDEPVGALAFIASSSYEYEGAVYQGKRGYMAIGARESELDVLLTTSRHRDVNLFISGTVSSRGTNTRGVTLVAGDLVVSGNTKMEGSVDLGSIDLANITLSSTAADEPFIRFRDTNHFVRRSSSGHLEFDDSQAPGGPFTLTQLAALAVTDNSDVFAVTHQDGSAPYLSYVATTGSFSFDHSKDTNGYTPRRTNQIGADVYFFVSGAIDGMSQGIVPDSLIDEGVAVFGGDLVTSGAIKVGTPASSVQVPLQVGTVGATIDTAIAMTGSLEMVDPVPGNDVRISVKGASSGLSFHVQTGESFKIGSDENVTFSGNNRIQLKNSSNRIYGVLDGGVEKLLIENQNTAGVIKINANNGAGHMAVTGSILPGTDSTFNLGSPDMRWANLYTGDLHLRNERGNWTIYEEPDMLVVVNNLTGKKYKMGLTPLEDEE